MRAFGERLLEASAGGLEGPGIGLHQAARIEPSTQWPPYDIEKVADDAYRITMAVAGFSQDEIELTALEDAEIVLVETDRIN